MATRVPFVAADLPCPDTWRADIQPLLDYFKDCLCNGDELQYQCLLKFLRDFVRNNKDRPSSGWVLLLFGSAVRAKAFFISVLIGVFGEAHFVNLGEDSTKHILSDSSTIILAEKKPDMTFCRTIGPTGKKTKKRTARLLRDYDTCTGALRGAFYRFLMEE